MKSAFTKILVATAAFIGTGAQGAVISGTGDPLGDPALAGGTQITFSQDFQTLPYSDNGVTFSATNTVPVVVGGYFATEGSNSLATVTFTFDAPVSAAAFNVISGTSDPWAFSIFSNGTLLESLLIPAGSYTNEYFGLTGDAITSATLARVSGDVENILIDNLTFKAAVPEPSTWLMMLLGFGAVGLAFRRRSAAARVSAA